MNEIKKETPPLQAPAIPVINPNVAEQYKAGKSVYDIFKNYGQEYDYDQEIKAAERNRKGALIADMATALSNIGTGIAGRRAYVNTPPATAQANQNIERLRQLRANQNVDYRRNRLNAMMQQYQIDRQDQFRREDNIKDEGRYRDQLGYRTRQEQAQNEDRTYRKQADERDYKFREKQLNLEKSNSDRNYNLNATNAAESRKLRELQLGIQAAKAGGTTGKKSYIIGAGGKKYEYPKEMTDAVTARLFDVMRDEASKEGITIDNTELLIGGNETKSSAMKAFVENNLSKYPGAEAELRRMFGEEVETPEVPVWITNNQPAPKKWVPGSAQQSTSKPVVKWTPKK